MTRGRVGLGGRAAAGLVRLRATEGAGATGGKVRVMKGRVIWVAFDSGDALDCTQPKNAQCAASTRAAIKSRGLSGAITRHSRAGGNPLTRPGWIPACAGMTEDENRVFQSQ